MSTEAVTDEVPEISLESSGSAAETAAVSATKNFVIGVFDLHGQAERAVKAFKTAGFPMRQLCCSRFWTHGVPIRRRIFPTTALAVGDPSLPWA